MKEALTRGRFRLESAEMRGLEALYGVCCRDAEILGL